VPRVANFVAIIPRPQLVAFARQAGASPHKQIILVLDRAGWHASQRLRVPSHVHLLFLPPGFAY